MSTAPMCVRSPGASVKHERRAIGRVLELDARRHVGVEITALLQGVRHEPRDVLGAADRRRHAVAIDDRAAQRALIDARRVDVALRTPS